MQRLEEFLPLVSRSYTDPTSVAPTCQKTQECVRNVKTSHDLKYIFKITNNEMNNPALETKEKKERKINVHFDGSPWGNSPLHSTHL